VTTDELRVVFVTSGLSCRVQRAEVTLEVCTFCGNERFNLGCSPEKGVYYCWACHAGGRLSDLLRKLTGQDIHIPVVRKEKTDKPKSPAAAIEFKSLPITEVGSAAQYLARRGISPFVAAQYGMVVCIDDTHRLNGRIAVPLRDFWTGELQGWTGRSYTGKEPKYLSTLPRKIITGWRTRNTSTPAVVVEGPMDGIAAHRAGYQVAVLSGIADSGIVDWAARLPEQTPVAIMLDDTALDEARRLYWQILPLRPGVLKVMELPEGQDPASLGVEGVRQALSAAGLTSS
jgi:DNA primase